MERQAGKRRRSARSCLECRRRKVKCDRNDPCAHCISAKIQCAYKFYRNESVVRQQPPQSSLGRSMSSPSVYAPSPTSQAHQISTNGAIKQHDSLLSGPQVDQAPVTAAAGQNDASNAFGRKDHQPPIRAQDAEPDSRDLLQRVRKLEESAASSLIHGLSETGRDILARQFGLPKSQIILNKTRILRWSHWMGTAPEI